MENVRLLEKIVLPHGGVPVGRDFLPRNVAGNGAPGTTVKIMTHVPVVPVVERVRVRQMIRPCLSVLAQLQRLTTCRHIFSRQADNF